MAHSRRFVSRLRNEELAYRHGAFETDVVLTDRGERQTTRMYCEGCLRVFFDGEINSLPSRMRFKAAKVAAANHRDEGHNVVYECPMRILRM